MHHMVLRLLGDAIAYG